MGTLSHELERCALIAIDTPPFIYFFERHPQFLPVSESVISRCDDPDDPLQAIELRARYRFPVPDAVQLATAIETGCQLFVTNDSRLRRVTEIPIAVLSDYLAAGS